MTNPRYLTHTQDARDRSHEIRGENLDDNEDYRVNEKKVFGRLAKWVNHVGFDLWMTKVGEREQSSKAKQQRYLGLLM